MGKLISAIFGGGSSNKVIQPDPAPVQDVEEDKKKAKKSKVALTRTQGGVAGEELGFGSVGGSTRIFGN